MQQPSIFMTVDEISNYKLLSSSKISSYSLAASFQRLTQRQAVYYKHWVF